MDLNMQNKALICKWLWRFTQEQDSWWKILIKEKFSDSGTKWFSGGISGSLGCSVWSQIIKEKAVFWRFAQVKPGSGEDTSFWLDYWRGDRSFAEEFPRMAAAAVSPLASIRDLAHVSIESVHWDIPFRTSFRGGVERERERFFDILNTLPPSVFSTGSDSVVWQAADKFSVHSLYCCLVKEKYEQPDDYPYKLIWQAWIPSKICTFLWIVHQRKILTHDSLKKRGWSFPSRCVMCAASEEDANHLFLHCSFAVRVWNIIGAFVHSARGTGSITQVINNWPRGKPANPKEWCTSTLLHALCWSLWKERNRRIFDGVANTEFGIAFRIGSLIALWLAVAGKVDIKAAEEWLRVLKSRTVDGGLNPELAGATVP
ncbi:unnamed protein product [Linum trigynum]|uniref:Reverse transcriptase zinc-binding domain-containing protein n=1 Tax=Linum trigynum TaxID=586398 RepID=A0AAV2GVC8_9ROSI